jgi:hypothetical protein
MKNLKNLMLLCTLAFIALATVIAAANPPQVLHRSFRAATVPAESDAIRLPVGSMMIWRDRGTLTPSHVYFGQQPPGVDPLTRLPAPPFSHFEPDDKDRMATSPKAKLTDQRGVKWIAKFGEEVHSDAIAPRLAWALGFGSVEGYYVPAGRIEGIGPDTNLGREKGSILPDGSFDRGARFKRHAAEDVALKDSKGNDMLWDEAHNPGVPPEQLSGLLIFEVLVENWDSQPKNCKVFRTKGPNGPENWYIVSDMGATFANPKHKFVLSEYARSTRVVRNVTASEVHLEFAGAIQSQARVHRSIPLADAQWFRKQLAKLTDAQIRAAFDAGFGTAALNEAYASGDESRINETRNRELSPDTREEISGFTAALRARINDFMQKVPE